MHLAAALQWIDAFGGGRHVIPVVLLLALVSLVVGTARPQRTVIADKRQATIILAIDTSRSMEVRPPDGGASRMERAAALVRQAAPRFAAWEQAGHRVAADHGDRAVIGQT